MAYDKKAEQERILKRNEEIRKRYIALTEVKQLGVRKYSEDYVLKKLEEEFFLAVRTIDGIIGYKYENGLKRKAEEAAGKPNLFSALDEIERKLVCKCKATISDQDIYYANQENELGENYVQLFALCSTCKTEYSKDVFGECENLNDARVMIQAYINEIESGEE